MKKAIAPYLILFISSLAISSWAAGQHFVDSIPKHVPVEKPPKPRSGYIWVNEEWHWSGDAYVFVSGRWVPAPYQNAVWTAGHWKKTAEGYCWIPGKWKKKA